MTSEMYWLMMTSQGFIFLTALVALWQAWSTRKKVAENSAQTLFIQHEINGRMTQLLEVTRGLARAQGIEEGAKLEQAKETKRKADENVG